VLDSWQGGRINTVLLFTDGENQDKNGISRPQLVNELRKLVDPKRPVRMIIISIGTETNPQELKEITDATGCGGVFTAEDPAKIGEIFLQAISSRSGATPK
jgi:Ca-activated chloride channel family protein